MADLDQLHTFIGTENYYRHWMAPKMLYTDGVRYVAEKSGDYGAHWLLDVIFSHQREPGIADVPFQIWTLVKHENGSATVTMTNGDSDTPLAQQEFTRTDFPLPRIAFWIENNVLMLPSER